MTLSTQMSQLRRTGMDRILVISHDGALRKILQRVFSSEAYEVDVAPDSVAGLEILGQRTHSAVVLDLPFPEALGVDLCRKIVNLIRGLPFVILSASSDVADEVLFLETGAGDYVTIPFSPKELAERLRGLVKRRSSVGLEKPTAPLLPQTPYRTSCEKDIPDRALAVRLY
jgi:DNA-binding response OmpR family regulator